MKRCSDARLLELLRESISPNESLLVLEHLDQCPNCRKRLQLMGALQSLANPSSKSSPPDRTWLLLVAAALLLLVTIPTSMVFRSPASREISEAAPYPHFPVEVRSQEANAFRARDQALHAYRLGDYRRACAGFERIPAASKTDTDYFFHGVSLYLTANYEAAIRSLEQVRAGRLARPARWYLAHSLLALKRGDEALTHLEHLSATPGEFQDSAVQLLKRLSAR